MTCCIKLFIFPALCAFVRILPIPLQVTVLNLDGQHISKLSNLERLDNLRWASFNDNDITRIEVCYKCNALNTHYVCTYGILGFYCGPVH